MRKKLILAIFATILTLTTPSISLAATKAKVASVKLTSAKKTVKKTVKKAAVCVRCKSRAEGVDNSNSAKATSWSGTVIGINDGEKSLVITEASVLNHIKAFDQRSVRITSDNKISNKDGEEKDFTNMDIGYRIQVKGVYDAKKRIVHATAIEIVTVPNAPVTKTK